MTLHWPNGKDKEPTDKQNKEYDKAKKDKGINIPKKTPDWGNKSKKKKK